MQMQKIHWSLDLVDFSRSQRAKQTSFANQIARGGEIARRLWVVPRCNGMLCFLISPSRNRKLMCGSRSCWYKWWGASDGCHISVMEIRHHDSRMKAANSPVRRVIFERGMWYVVRGTRYSLLATSSITRTPPYGAPRITTFCEADPRGFQAAFNNTVLERAKVCKVSKVPEPPLVPNEYCSLYIPHKQKLRLGKGQPDAVGLCLVNLRKAIIQELI